MIKITLLYGHPQSPQAFERYYKEIHLPLAGRMGGVARLELTRFGPGLDAEPPEYYRMAELYFASAAQLQATLGSPEGQAVVADLPNFATGGVTVMVGTVDA